MHKNLFRISIFVGSIALATVFGAACANAQTFKPGDKVEYKVQNFPEKWETGTVVRDIPGESRC